MSKSKKRVIYVETEVKCPNCNNFLLEAVKVPHEFGGQREEEDLLVGKRLGYYCSECGEKYDSDFAVLDLQQETD